MPIPQLPPPARSPWQKLLLALIALALFVPLLMFSAALLAVLLIVAVIGGGILWWKTRTLRQQMRQMQQMREFQPPPQGMDDFGDKGAVIEGEVVRVKTER